MERKKKVKPSWRKIGGGSLRLPGRIIKPNQVFQADRSELPDLFMKYLVPVGAEAEKAMKAERYEAPIDEKNIQIPEYKKVKVSGSSEFIKEETGKGWFDVKDNEGKKVNEKSLREKEADALIEDLSDSEEDLYDVVDQNGKKVNDQPLNEKEVNELLKSLME